MTSNLKFLFLRNLGIGIPFFFFFRGSFSSDSLTVLTGRESYSDETNLKGIPGAGHGLDPPEQ